MLRAPLQDIDLRARPVLEQLFESHHHGRARGIEHVHVQTEPGLEIGEFKQALFEQVRIDIAAARHQHNANVLIAFIAHIF